MITFASSLMILAGMLLMVVQFILHPSEDDQITHASDALRSTYIVPEKLPFEEEVSVLLEKLDHADNILKFRSPKS